VRGVLSRKKTHTNKEQNAIARKRVLRVFHPQPKIKSNTHASDAAVPPVCAVFTLPDSSFSSATFLDPENQPLIIVVEVVVVVVCSSAYNNLVACAPKRWCFRWDYNN
jgi:hypothetical protein